MFVTFPLSLIYRSVTLHHAVFCVSPQFATVFFPNTLGNLKPHGMGCNARHMIQDGIRDSDWGVRIRICRSLKNILSPRSMLLNVRPILESRISRQVHFVGWRQRRLSQHRSSEDETRSGEVAEGDATLQTRDPPQNRQNHRRPCRQRCRCLPSLRETCSAAHPCQPCLHRGLVLRPRHPLLRPRRSGCSHPRTASHPSRHHP